MSELFKLKNGTVLVSTEAPGGIYNSAQLKKIADLCSKELAIVKATEDQRLALFVKETELDRVIAELKATGLGFRNYQDGLHQPVSCLGELCESHEQPALTTAMDLTRLIANLNLTSPLKIGINGCARCCTPCHTLDISVVGEASGYRVSLGGKTSQFPELASFFAESVPAKELPALLATIVELFKAQAEPGESFHDVLDRVGTTDFVAALSPYSQDAAHRGDDPFAVDVASESPASEGGAFDEGMDLPSEELIESEAPESETASVDNDEGFLDIPEEDSILPSADEDIPVLDEEPCFDFSKDESEEVTLDEVRISDDAEPGLSHDVLMNGGEEPALEDDSELIFDDEALMSQELLDSEPDLLEDESVELNAGIPEELSEVPELGEELLEPAEVESTSMLSDSEELLGDEESLSQNQGESLGEVSEAMSELDEDILEPSALAGDSDSEAVLLDDDSDGEAMDVEEERLFEEKLKASIEEDKRLRDAVEADENVSARADALRLLESAAPDEDVSEAELALGLSDDEETLLALEDEAMPTRAMPGVTSLTPTQNFDFEGFDLIDQTLRVTFGSGAYLDFQLDSLEIGKTRMFRAAGSTIRVTHEDSGFSIEGGGMKMFYPNGILKVAS